MSYATHPWRVVVACAVLLCGALPAKAEPESVLRRAVDPRTDAEIEAATKGAPAPATPEAPAPAPAAPVAIEPEATGLAERVAQMMMVTLEGSVNVNANDLAFMRRYPPGAILIDTVSKPSVAAAYVGKIRELERAVSPGVPFLIGTNLFALPRREKAFQGFFAQLPSLLALAAAGRDDTTRNFAQVLAEHMDLMGFNFHLGPSLELAPDLPGATGTIDCLGSNPDFAAVAAGIVIEALDAKGILSMPTGFPGGGNNRVGKDPAVLTTPVELLKHADLLPFQRAIEAGAPMIHVGTTLVPMLDEENRPACLSPRVMRELLRGQLGFEGVVVAGPMDSPDLRAYGDPAEVAVAAIRAGADMLWWRSAGQQVMRTIDRVVAAVEGDDVPSTRIDEAVERIVALKTERGLAARAVPEVGKAEALEQKRFYGKSAYEVERRSITLLRNRDNILPLSKEKSMPVLVTGVAGIRELDAALEKHLKHVLIQPITSAKHGGEIYDFEIRRISKGTGGIRTAICVFTNAERVEGQIEVVRALRSRGVRVVVLLLGYPSHVHRMGEADAVLLAYCSSGALGSTMDAVAEVLAGLAPLRILPPVRDIEVALGAKAQYNVYDVICAPAGRLPVTIAPPFVAGLSVPYASELSLKKAEWDFGDGKAKAGFTVDRSYEEPGRYPVTLRLTDTNGEQTSETFHVIVSGQAEALPPLAKE